MERHKQEHLRELTNSYGGTEYKEVVSAMRSTIALNIDDKTSESDKITFDKDWVDKNK